MFRKGQVVTLVGIASDLDVLLDDDFAYDRDEFDILRVAEMCELPVTVVSEETDNYWNVQIGNRTIHGLSDKYLCTV